MSSQNQLDYEINKELGECYLFMGDFDKAEDYYKKANTSMETQPEPYMGLATIAIQRGDFDTAMDLYSKAFDLGLQDKALAGIGLIKMELGEDEEAFSYFEKAARANPANAVALNCLVREGYKLNRLESVVSVLEECVNIFPDREELRISLAGCLISLGRNKEAIKQIETVLEYNPSSIVAREFFNHIMLAA